MRGMLAIIGVILLTGLAGCAGYTVVEPANFDQTGEQVMAGAHCTMGAVDLTYTGPQEEPKVQMKLQLLDNGTVVSDWVYVSRTFPQGESVRVSADFCGDRAHDTANEVEWRVNENGRK